MQKPQARRTARLLWLIGLALGVVAGLAVAIPLAHSSATADALVAAAPAGD